MGWYGPMQLPPALKPEFGWEADLAVRPATQHEDPLAPVRILGGTCKVHHNDNAYYSTERETSLVRWNDREDTTIDRFDGARARLRRPTASWDICKAEVAQPPLCTLCHRTLPGQSVQARTLQYPVR